MRAWESFLRVRGWESEYGSVDRYLKHYRRRIASEGTRELACDTLMGFCKFAGEDPDSLAGLEVAEASKLVQGFIDSRAKRGLSVRTVNVGLAFLKAFFRLNGFKGDRELDVERYYQPTRYRKRPEYVPTADEVYRMAYASGSSRNKALILSLYTSGFRNSTLRALLYRDVKAEVEGGRDVVKVPVYPEMKKAVAAACKGNIAYYSFLSKETTQALREYLDERKKMCGGIGDAEPLFASTCTNVDAGLRRTTFVKKRSLDALVKTAAHRASIDSWRNVYPHCLRKAFESALRNNRIDPKDQEFLMGHILPGSQDPYYDKTKVEELKGKYAGVAFFSKGGLSDEEFRKRQLLDTARFLEYPPEKIKRLEEALAKYRTLDEAFEGIRKLKLDGFGRDASQGLRKIVDESELQEHLTEGWDIQTVLPSGKIVILRTG